MVLHHEGISPTDSSMHADSCIATVSRTYSVVTLQKRSPMKRMFSIVLLILLGASLARSAGTMPSVSASTAATPGSRTSGGFIGVYEFTGTSTGDGQFNTVTEQPVSCRFSQMKRVGVAWTSAKDVFNSNSWSTIASRDDGKYVMFSLQMNAGSVIPNAPISFVFDNMRSATGPASGEVQYRYGTEAFASSATWTVPTAIATQTMTIPAPGNTTSDYLEIRIFGWGATGTPGTMRFDNVKLTIPDNPLGVEPQRQGNKAPSAFVLEQNYPNPFNPSTVIDYQTADRAHVLLAVYDELGREVARLVDADQAPGLYSARWNAAAVPSGMYFYRLITGSHTFVKKMMVQK
jgi:hypothetical protein